RRRVQPARDSYQAPWFPLVPALGVSSCLTLALVEAIAVPNAGGIAAMWLGFGGLLYFALFKTRAEIADASAEAIDPSLGLLRGKSPLVLVPIANPSRARALIEMANALAPSKHTRVLLLTNVDSGGSTEDAVALLGDAQRVVSEALTLSLGAGYTPDAIITTSGDAWSQIRRIAQFHECETLLLGLGQLPSGKNTLSPELDDLIDDIDCDVALLRAPDGWELGRARRIVVPIGGKGEEHLLRARVLGSLSRTGDRELHFVTVLPATSTDAQQEHAHVRISRLARTKIRGTPIVEVIRDDDPVAALRRAVAGADLVILGQKSIGGRRKASSPIAIAIAAEAPGATLLLSSRRVSVYQPLRDMVGAISELTQDATSDPSGHR
ncbi:MAG TPA: universal stress protein, partial [Kofleriaceae bacterium]|nr:universal stress protein [Kofleriaceae bacterium]